MSQAFSNGGSFVTTDEEPIVPAQETLPNETGWILEKDDPPVYHLVTDDYDEHWTSDVNKALRFARKEDAEAYMDHVGWTAPPVRSAEHMWVAPRAVRWDKPVAGAIARGLTRRLPAYADPNFRYDEKTMSYHRIKDDNAPPPEMPSPSAEQIDEVILQFARERGRSINLTYDSGSYEITKTTGAARNLAITIAELCRGRVSAPAAQPNISPVAWRVRNDFHHWHATCNKALADTWREIEKLDVQALYTQAPSPAGSEEQLANLQYEAGMYQSLYEAAQVNMHKRDDFLVAKGLWDEFTRSLPSDKRPPTCRQMAQGEQWCVWPKCDCKRFPPQERK